MEMKPVQSLNIEAIGHEGDEMHVKFKNGGTYVFNGVKAEDFECLCCAKSVGRHFTGMGIKGTKLAEKKK